MVSWSRRTAVRSIFAGFALAGSPLLALSGIRLPDKPMRLTRLLVRGLSDGKEIVVERSWLVRFTANGAGAAINGHQIEVRVDAPERIAAIADIERSRSADQMFPVVLGADGLIQGTRRAQQSPDVAAAISLAQEMVTRSSLTAEAAQQANDFLAQIQLAGSTVLEGLPRDLFYPRGNAVHETRALGLPDGSRGEFELAYIAAADPADDWLAHAERRIITRLAGSERSSRELWTMREA